VILDEYGDVMELVDALLQRLAIPEIAGSPAWPVPKRPRNPALAGLH
jgi:hypothetical protein